MKQFSVRLVKLIAGLALYSLGIVMTIQAHIGYEPWDVFHVGLARTTGLSIGTVLVIVGLVIVILIALLGERLGLGTLLNMVLIGVFIDLIMALGVIHQARSLLIGIPMLLTGLLIIAVASYLYISSAFGAGPRDSLMVVLSRKTKLPIGVCRGAVELSVTLVGWLLGGMVGIGTVISVLMIGVFIQLVFRLFKFNVTTVRHETLKETLISLRGQKRYTE